MMIQMTQKDIRFFRCELVEFVTGILVTSVLRYITKILGENKKLLFRKIRCYRRKSTVCGINEPNSTMQRLIRKLNLLDAVDEQSSSGKLDLIIQLPYVIKSEARRQQAEKRRKDIEQQLSGSKYGIAYTDGTERTHS